MLECFVGLLKFQVNELLYEFHKLSQFKWVKWVQFNQATSKKRFMHNDHRFWSMTCDTKRLTRSSVFYFLYKYKKENRTNIFLYNFELYLNNPFLSRLISLFPKRCGWRCASQGGKFIFPINFIILDMEEDREVPFVLGRPFLTIGSPPTDVQEGKLTMRVNGQVTLKILFLWNIQMIKKNASQLVW